MVHYLWIKMINQIISYFDSKKNHTLSYNRGSELTCPNWQGGFFLCLSFGVLQIIVNFFGTSVS
jgi:hypothetical protein